MNRYIASEHLRAWIEANQPNAVAKLAVATGLSISAIQKMNQGIYKHNLKPYLMKKLAEAMNLTTDDLFPTERKNA